ncbi:CHAT domain-containing protein, partial [Micromonospora sp. CPCC 205371]|nr:CHAT domain-containing protein [Micromonospora sp. CPCC 205371]
VGGAAGWLAQARRAGEAGGTAAMLAACGRGLDAAGEHQRSLAAPELRAHAAGYGTELAALAQRHAVDRGDARMLLRWSERWRAGALAVPLVRPPDDRELAADLASLRQVMRLLAAPGAPVVALERERRRLGAAGRSRTPRGRRRP